MSKKKASKNQVSDFSVRFIFSSEEERDNFIKDVRTYVADDYDFSALIEDYVSEESSDNNSKSTCTSASLKNIDDFFAIDDDQVEDDYDEIPDDPEEATIKALKDNDGDVELAAYDLGVNPSTIYRRANRFGINIEDYR